MCLTAVDSVYTPYSVIVLYVSASSGTIPTVCTIKTLLQYHMFSPQLDYSNSELSNLTSTKDYFVFCHTVVEPPDLMYTLPSYGGLNKTLRQLQQPDQLKLCNNAMCFYPQLDYPNSILSYYSVLIPQLNYSSVYTPYSVMILYVSVSSGTTPTVCSVKTL